MGSADAKHLRQVRLREACGSAFAERFEPTSSALTAFPYIVLVESTWAQELQATPPSLQSKRRSRLSPKVRADLSALIAYPYIVLVESTGLEPVTLCL